MGKVKRFLFVRVEHQQRCDGCKRVHRNFIIKFLGMGAIRFMCGHCWRSGGHPAPEAHAAW